MTDTFLDMAADSPVPILSGTHSIFMQFFHEWKEGEESFPIIYSKNSWDSSKILQ